MVDSAMPNSIAHNFIVQNQARLTVWMKVMAISASVTLAACGGNHSSGPPASSPDTLSYDMPRALYVTGESIATNHARVTGGPVTSFTVSPALPNGLSLDAQNGAITGTPTTLQRETSHVVTASGTGGSAQTPLRITVTGRGSWTAVPTVPAPRHYATLTRLTDGRQLLAGGFAAGGPTNAADIYNPAANSWNAAAPMLLARSDPMAVALGDGRVLVFGGEDPALNSLAQAELYDPVANTWTATGSLNQARVRPTAHTLPDGKVLVTGGYSRMGGPTSFLNTAEVYDPATGLWSLLPAPLSSARAQHAAQLLPGGSELLLVGGVNSLGFVSTAERYAVDGSGTTPIAYGGSGNVHLSVRLDDGSVLVMADGSTTARRFDPATSSWTTSTMSATRSLPTMTLLTDGRVLLAGGSSLNTAEIYNPDHNTWTTAAPMPSVRRSAVSALLDDGRVLAVSGFENAGEVNATEVFAP